MNETLTKADLIRLVRAYMDKDDWKYEFEEAREMIKAGVSLKNKLKSAKLRIVFNDNGFTTYAIAPLSADEDTMGEVAKFLHGANYGLRNGNFELDYRDGEVRYKVYYNTKGCTELSDPIIDDALYLPFAMMKKYGDGLAAVVMGFSDAAEALKAAEGK